MGLDRTFSFRASRYYVDPKPFFENVHMKSVEIRVFEADDWAVYYCDVLVPVYLVDINLDGSYGKLIPFKSKKMEASYEITF